MFCKHRRISAIIYIYILWLLSYRYNSVTIGVTGNFLCFLVEKSPTARLHISNLTVDTTQDMLKDSFPDATETVVVMSRDTGKSKGYVQRMCAVRSNSHICLQNRLKHYIPPQIT